MLEITSISNASGLTWRAELFPYQRVGIDRLIREPSLLLADEMGLGKTIQAIAAIRVLNARGMARSVLLVIPAGLVRQWRQQLREWAPELKLSTVVGSQDERATAWAARGQVYI